ncbi:hypothetical protein ABPG75_010794 [Micractinium tetrahymenae]
MWHLSAASDAFTLTPTTPARNLQRHVPGGTIIFSGDYPFSPDYCPEPAGTPCQSLGNYNATASTGTLYVYTGGDTCQPGIAWRTNVQFVCSPGASDTLAAARRNETMTLPGRDQPGGLLLQFSSGGLQVYRNGQVCNNQTGALWGAVATYQCTEDPSIGDDTIVAARVNRQTCTVSVTVASPRACTLQCTSPLPFGKRACGVLKMPQPAAGQAVLNISSTPSDVLNITFSYFSPALAANNAAGACVKDLSTNKISCRALGKYNALASTPAKQDFDRGADFCDQSNTKRYSTDATWVCVAGLRQDKLVLTWFNSHTCRVSLNVLSAKAWWAGYFGVPR